MEILKAHGRVHPDEFQRVLEFQHRTSTPSVPLLALARPAELSFGQRACLCGNDMGRQLMELMECKQTNLCVAADVTTKRELLQLADLVGPEICLLKTHIDLIEDFDHELTSQLVELSRQHRFFLFEDRKLADIAATAARQYNGGLYRICEWADIVNAHLLAGEAAVAALGQEALQWQQQQQEEQQQHRVRTNGGSMVAPPRGLLLVAQMSTAQSASIPAVLSLARAQRGFVFGFICQERLSESHEDLGFLYCCPGIHLEAREDQKGQHYRTPQAAIRESRADIAIVGRGVTAAVDRIAAVRAYRAAAWKAYQDRLHPSCH